MGLVEITTDFGQTGLMSECLPNKYYKLLRHLLSHSMITKVHIFAPYAQIITRFEDSAQMFIYIDMAHAQRDGSNFDFWDTLKGWTLTQVSREGAEIQLELWQKVRI